MTFDAKGIPGVNVVSMGFTDAVAAQSRALGFDPGVVFVPHPIQNRTAEELARIADEALAPVLRMLTSGGPC